METDVCIRRVEAVQERLDALREQASPDPARQEALDQAQEAMHAAMEGWREARDDLARQADRLRVLHEMDRAFLAARSMEETAWSALRYVGRLLPCQRASVALFDPRAGEMSLLAVHAPAGTRLGKGWCGPLGGPWSLPDLCQGRTCEIEDVQSLAPSSPLVEALQMEGVHAYVSVPLILQGKLAGTFNVGRGWPGRLEPEERDIVLEMAIRLAIGVHQARLHEQVRRHADEMERQVLRRTAALRTSEARFRAIFEGAGIGMALVDKDGRLEECNPAFQEMMGFEGRELRGTRLGELAHPEDARDDVDLYEELVAGKRDRYALERRYIRHDGEAVWCRQTVSLARRGRRGKHRFAIAMVEDITRRKQALEALVQAEKLALTGRLAASLAHEINNPLQAVIGCLGLAEESLAKGEEVGELLQIATEELERAAAIVAHLRDLNRPSNLQDREPTDVTALLEQVLTLTKKQCQKHDVEVLWNRDRDPGSLLLVPDRMRQVFLNLILNAVEAASSGGSLVIDTHRTDDPAGVSISFIDDGRGIPPDVLPRVFDPFFTTKPEGLGMGLYVTRNIIQDHGGTIDVESSPGVGTAFEVWLPA